MVLSVGAINSILVKLGLRGYCSINVETSETLDTLFCCSNSVGATTINQQSIAFIKDTKKKIVWQIVF